jgi:putative aldouronate transport system substrate-binding protein
MITVVACSGKSNTPDEAGAGTQTATAQPDPSGTKEPIKQVQLKNGSAYDRKNSPQEKRVHDLIQEKTGVDMEVLFSATGQWDNKMNLMLSSGEQLDLIPFVNPNTAVSLYKNDAIVNLDELLDKYGPNLKKNINPKAWALATYQGKIIGIPNEPALSTPNTLLIRTDWLKNLNLQTPVTIEEFEKVLEAFKNNDPDKNGKNDTFPISIRGDFSNLEKAFAPFFLPAGMNAWQDDKGKLLPAELHPNYKEMMAKFIEWNKKGYIWSDLLQSNVTKQIEIMAQNKIGVVAGTFSSTLTGVEEVLVKTIPEANYDPLLLQGKGINKVSTIPYTLSMTVVTKRNKHPEAAIKFLDYLATQEGYNNALYGIEGDNYTKLPDGRLDFIGEDKADYTKAQYYGRFYSMTLTFKDSLQWPFNTWMDKKHTLNKEKMSKLPSFDPIDVNVVYDQTLWKSSSKLNDMTTYLLQQKYKMFTGELPLGEWDKSILKWKEIGGDQMIEDKTAQFLAAKK